MPDPPGPGCWVFAATSCNIRSGSHNAPVVEWRKTSGELIAELSRSDISALEAAGYTPPLSFVAASVDGNRDSHGLIYRPFNFDPQQKYPVIELIYAGMQVSHVPHDFYGFGRSSSSLVLRSLLHLGFVVLMIDAPGTPDRGRAYQDATYRIWPQTVIPNHALWIREAASAHPWMDITRVGQPTYIEPFMGLPAENPEGYAVASNLALIDQIQGPVLVMPMPMDVNAGFSPGMKFLNAINDGVRVKCQSQGT